MCVATTFVQDNRWSPKIEDHASGPSIQLGSYGDEIEPKRTVGGGNKLRKALLGREGIQDVFDQDQISLDEFIDKDLLKLEIEAKRWRMLSVLHRFETIGLSFGVGEEVKSDPVSVEASIAFLKALPDQYRLPKIAPDGEGGVTMRWSLDHFDVIVSVDGWSLYTTVAPSSDNPEYLDVFNFDGSAVPKEILKHIPTTSFAP